MNFHFISTDNISYLSAVPDVLQLLLKSTDRFLVLGSDGLFEAMSLEDIAAFLFKSSSSGITDVNTLSKKLILEAIGRSAKRMNLTLDQLEKLPSKLKRNVHDDMTVIIVDLYSNKR